MGFFSLLDSQTSRGATLPLLFLLAADLGGCGDSAPPAPLDTPELARCDITTGPCQLGIYQSLVEMLEADGALMPNVRTISVDEHADEVRNGLDIEDLTGEDATSRGLRLLGFIPEASESLTATQAEYWINQVAAYYSRGSNRITVIDRDYEQGSAQVLLAHELIHAIQHSQFGLNNVGSGADTEDSVIGVRSVIEGDAVYSSFAWYYDVSGVDLGSLDWEETFADRTARLRDRLADPEIALIDTASSFPYAYGFQYMATGMLTDGLPARTAAFELPPSTTAAVLAGYDGVAPALSLPEVAHPSPLEGNTLEVENRYGAWYVYGFLRRQGVEEEQAWTAALSWVGDELAIYRNGDEVVVVWRVRFDDAVNAGVLRDQVNAGAGESARSAVAFGDDAFVFAAETNETLLAWAELPLDETTASIVPKGARVWGGPVSVGTCLLLQDSSVIDPHSVLR